jgi:hypothetical protein
MAAIKHSAKLRMKEIEDSIEKGIEMIGNKLSSDQPNERTPILPQHGVGLRSPHNSRIVRVKLSGMLSLMPL